MSEIDPMIPSPWRVADRWDETHDVFSLLLEPTDQCQALQFSPGQFNMLYSFGAGESAISISSDPEASDGKLVHTIRRVGTVTSALSRLNTGDQIGLRGPFGNPWPMDAMRGRDLVFVAGGIGLAPVRPAILHALSHRDDYGKIVILAGAREPKEVMFAEELNQWGTLDGVESRLTVDRAEEGWTRSVGVVTKLIPKADFDPANAAALICGPEIMMRYTAIELRNRGVTDDRIFVTMERNMKCAIAICGHCQLGPEFICKDGPVFRFDRIAFWFSQREV
jgi:NAD(P)H-flavin reductase